MSIVFKSPPVYHLESSVDRQWLVACILGSTMCHGWFSSHVLWSCFRACARSKETKGVASDPLYPVWPCFLPVVRIRVLFKHWFMERTPGAKRDLKTSSKPSFYFLCWGPTGWAGWECTFSPSLGQEEHIGPPGWWEEALSTCRSY